MTKKTDEVFCSAMDVRECDKCDQQYVDEVGDCARYAKLEKERWKNDRHESDFFLTMDKQFIRELHMIGHTIVEEDDVVCDVDDIRECAKCKRLNKPWGDCSHARELLAKKGSRHSVFARLVSPLDLIDQLEEDVVEEIDTLTETALAVADRVLEDAKINVEQPEDIIECVLEIDENE